MVDKLSNSNEHLFLNEIIERIRSKDKLHSKKIDTNISYFFTKHRDQFEELLKLVHIYFDTLSLSPTHVAENYLKMVNDMRREGLYFYKNGKYRCENQSIAYEQVYSKTEIMSYYMNALLISQILWKHHFKIFVYFENSLKNLFPSDSRLKILDIGPGHGFFSYIVKKHFRNYEKLDIVDISETSLEMTRRIIKSDGDKINYFKKDIFDYEDSGQYDLILLGEVIEHLDSPRDILVKLSRLLKKNGILWVTTPTNAPALDHVYLFSTKQEVIDLVEGSSLNIIDECNFFAEDVDEEIAIRQRITNLVGLFCKSSNV
jgi:2-polyprenyl-3-methyl-5-hydroxy-6-metoxy-1,4-benzoquinol methylase